MADKNMRLLAVTFAYHPEIKDFRANISRYLDYVDHLIVWDNTPDAELKGKLAFDAVYDRKIDYMGVGRNVGIAHAANRAIEYGLKNGYTHILSMDQDSTWVDFDSYRQDVENTPDSTVAVFSPRLFVNGQIRPDDPTSCFTSGSIIPLAMFEKLGLFREDYLIDAVDTEFCFRCRKVGYSIKYSHAILYHKLGCEDIIMAHGKKYTSNNYPPFRLYHIIRNEWFLYKDYKGTNIGRSLCYTYKRHRYFIK